MSDSVRAASSEPRFVLQSHTRWGVEIGGFRVALTRTHQGHEGSATPTRAAPVARGAWPFAAGAVAGVGAVALLVVGASAAPRATDPVRYMVSVPIPTAAPHPMARLRVRKPVASRPAPAIGAPFDAGDAPYVARAMATGAFQEWEDTAGQRRFLTAGPARLVGDRHCRDMALMVRFAEGGSRVRSAERCTAAPVEDAPDVPPEVMANTAD